MWRHFQYHSRKRWVAGAHWMLLGRHVQYNADKAWIGGSSSAAFMCHVEAKQEFTREHKDVLLLVLLVLVLLPLHSSALVCSTSVSRVVAPSRLQCYLGIPPTCAVVRRLIPVQRDEWTEEVNEALWIDEKVSVRVHKVNSCSVLSPLGSPKITFWATAQRSITARSSVSPGASASGRAQRTACKLASSASAAAAGDKCLSVHATLSLMQVRDPGLYRWPIQLELLAPANVAKEL